MKFTPYVAPICVLALSLAVLARSETQPKRPDRLSGCLRVGDHLTLSTSSGKAYQLGVVGPEEVERIRQEIRDYPVRLREYEAKRKELAEPHDRLVQEYEALRKEEIQRRRQTNTEPGNKAPADARKRGGLDSPEMQARLAKSQELRRAMDKLIRPSSPMMPYQVTAVGDDYVAISDEKKEIFIPLHSILDIRRKIGSP